LVAFPVGVFEVTGTGTRFISLHDTRRLAAVGFSAFCLGLILKSSRKR
jgi:hypothetical protein